MLSRLNALALMRVTLGVTLGFVWSAELALAGPVRVLPLWGFSAVGPWPARSEYSLRMLCGCGPSRSKDYIGLASGSRVLECNSSPRG